MGKYLMFVVVAAGLACAGAPTAEPPAPAPVASPTPPAPSPAAPARAGKRGGKRAAPDGADLTVLLGTWYQVTMKGNERVIANPDCDNHPFQWTFEKTASGWVVTESDGWGAERFEIQEVTAGDGYLELHSDGKTFTVDTVGGTVNTIINPRGGNYDVGQPPRFPMSPDRC